MNQAGPQYSLANQFVGDILSVSSLISLVTSISDLLTSNLLRVIARGVGNLLTNFGVSGTFRSRLMGEHLSDGPFRCHGTCR